MDLNPPIKYVSLIESILENALEKLCLRHSFIVGQKFNLFYYSFLAVFEILLAIL